VPRSGADSARHLQGRIDELAVLSAPLSPVEILQAYEAGRVDRAEAVSLVKNISP